MASPGNEDKNSFIESVNLLAADEQLDNSAEQLLAAESTYIRNWREKSGRDTADQDKPRHLTGLALSGGGIRSATFSLGVMQALAHRDLLKRFDYLSTVSGGGYTGSALTWLTSHKARRLATKERKAKRGSEEERRILPEFDFSAGGFPFGTDDPSGREAPEDTTSQQSMLMFLRQHGNYLTPGAGISFLSLVGVILRGLLLNLLVWMPVFILINLAGLHWAALFKEWLPLSLLPRFMPDGAIAEGDVLHGYDFLLWCALGLALLTVAGIIVYSIMSRFKRGHERELRSVWYLMRRRSELLLAIALTTIVLCFVIGLLPALDSNLNHWWVTTGPGAIIAGVGMAIYRFIQSLGSNDNPSMDKMLPVIAILLIYGTFLVTFQITWHYVWPLYTGSSEPVAQFGLDLAYWEVVGVLALFSALLGSLVNLNYVSIHRYYRDRLMETFMPDFNVALRNGTSAANHADSSYISALSQETDPTGPYHIVNTNVVLVGSEQPRYRQRGGDNFILSPRYCGSSATGWQPTEKYMNGHMSLATAVAISGAAANPNAGVGGAGITRNKPLSLVMSFLNVRLGYWAQNPRGKYHNPNYFLPGIYEFLNVLNIKLKTKNWRLNLNSFREDQNFVQLSDGGHFENTGVYELIRRQVRLVVACDGGADPEFSFSDFQTTVRRVEDDFGARIRVRPDYTPDFMIPRTSDTPVYPEKRAFSQRGFMICDVLYRDGSQGVIIYLKTALIKDVSFKVKGYAAQNPEFPDQTTADQFFDESQVDAYRELGYRIAESMMQEIDLPSLMDPS